MDDPGAWCCEEWCYVDASCPTAIPSWTNSTPGGTTLYWSYLSCDIADVDPVAAAALLDEDPEDQVCKWEPEVSCECTGSNSGFPFDEAPLYNNASLFPADYGTSCTAWELDECAAMWPSVDDLGAWCCANWCYVDRSCPYAMRSWTDADLWWTWKACDTASDQLDTCEFIDYYERIAANAAAAAGSIGVVGLAPGTHNGGQVTRTFSVPQHGFDVTRLDGYVPALFRSPLDSQTVVKSISIKAANGTSLLPTTGVIPAIPTAGYTMPAYDGSTQNDDFEVRNRRRLLVADYYATDESAAAWAAEHEVDEEAAASPGRRLLSSRSGSRGGSRSGTRSSSSSRSGSRSGSSSSSSSSSSSGSRSGSRSGSSSRTYSSRTPAASSSSSPAPSSSRTSGMASVYTNPPSTYQNPPTRPPPPASHSPDWRGEVKRYHDTNLYNSKYQASYRNQGGYRYTAGGKLCDADVPPPKALSYAADAGPFEDGGVTSFHLGGRYGSYSAEKAAYWKHGYGVPINPRYRPGQNGRNWFVGAMEVADHGFSGLAFAGSSRAAPFDEIHVNFLADAEECYYSAANASTALAAHDSYRCKLMITACVEWSASNTGWCDKSKFASGATRPAYPTLTTDDARELKSQIEAYLACADEAVDATTPAGGRLTSCPVPLTADYMLDALFAFGVIRVDEDAFPLEVSVVFDNRLDANGFSHAAQPNFMFGLLKTAGVSPLRRRPSSNVVAAAAGGSVGGFLFIGICILVFVYRKQIWDGMKSTREAFQRCYRSNKTCCGGDESEDEPEKKVAKKKKTPALPPPPPFGTHPIPPNAHVYAHVYLLHWAHNIFVEEYGGPREKVFDFYRSITRIKVSFDIEIEGDKKEHSFDWEGPAPEAVVAFLQAEPMPVFASPALGEYWDDLDFSGKVEDAALVAAMDYAMDWALKVYNYRVDPYRDIIEIKTRFDLLTAQGEKHKHKHEHTGGPDDRMQAYKKAACRVRGWNEPKMPPPPPGTHPRPPNAHVYAHVYLLHWAHRIFVEEYGGPREKVFDWYRSITRIKVSFDIVIEGDKKEHSFDWEGPAPEAVVAFLAAEPMPIFLSPALGGYAPGVDLGGAVEDAALVAAMDYAIEWAKVTEGKDVNPYTDILEVKTRFDLLTAQGETHKHKHEHTGGPDERMQAYKMAAQYVRQW